LRLRQESPLLLSSDGVREADAEFGPLESGSWLRKQRRLSANETSSPCAPAHGLDGFCRFVFWFCSGASVDVREEQPRVRGRRIEHWTVSDKGRAVRRQSSKLDAADAAEFAAGNSGPWRGFAAWHGGCFRAGHGTRQHEPPRWKEAPP